MHKLYVSSLFIAFILFYSFSTNPPDGNTGAPGDQLCTQCHDIGSGTQNGTITVEGFPESITPNETYMLTAVNRLTEGTAVRGGFQVTILGSTHMRAGDFINPSSTSAVTTFNNRQYWDHDPALEYPDSNVVKWTVQWKAPDMPAGSIINWYAAGNIANGNFQNTQDRIVTATGVGSIVLSASQDVARNTPSIFPNPGNDIINIVQEDASSTGTVYFYNLHGENSGSSPLEAGKVNVSFLPPGFYLLEIRQNDKIYFARWSKL